jgi:hypothetical protein
MNDAEPVPAQNQKLRVDFLYNVKVWMDRFFGF